MRSLIRLGGCLAFSVFSAVNDCWIRDALTHFLIRILTKCLLIPVAAIAFRTAEYRIQETDAYSLCPCDLIPRY